MKRFLLSLACVLTLSAAQAQSTLYQQYIEKYKTFAVEQMMLHGIPASITLAQGLLESGAGTSTLATKANNHFGIKTGGTWQGPYVLRDDDRPGERFRKYASARESYEDHSLFLTSRPRYASLFQLDRTDYRGWAHGLKAAGYATNPEYARKLISIIELYHLDQYDQPAQQAHAKKHHTRKHAKEAPAPVKQKAPAPRLYVGRCNGRYYVVAREGDTYGTIAATMNADEHKLRRYNEADRQARLSKGDIVYLQKKQRHAVKSLRGTTHQLAAGESLYDVSQRYGVTLKALLKANRNQGRSLAPRVGERIVLP